VVSYVAIRADEDHREGYSTTHDRLEINMPFRTDGVDRERVIEILSTSGVGMPKYYEWRSRSGCTFCFFQQKIEWVRLKRQHPSAFEEAKGYEKTAIESGSPFTWSQGESLIELEQPERVAEIEADYEARRQRERASRRVNPLRVLQPTSLENLDELYLADEGNGACHVCHK